MNLLALLGALLFAGPFVSGQSPRITRADLAGIERGMDLKLERASIAEPYDLLGPTRGVYIEGYGVVFSSELNLIISANLSPFHPSFTKQEIERVHDRKAQRMPALRQHMRQLLIDAAASLENLPPNEQVVLAVTLFHYKWEDYSGLPSQIVMQAQRQQLLNNETRESAIRVQEF